MGERLGANAHLVTFNAMQGDRQLCLAARMDDYIAKPLKGYELVAAVERVSKYHEG